MYTVEELQLNINSTKQWSTMKPLIKINRNDFKNMEKFTIQC